MLAEPTTVRGRPAALVVARSFAPRDETLDHLLGELLLAGPARAPARRGRRLRARGRGAATGRGDARARGGDLGLDAGARLPVPAARDEISRLAETLNEMLARLEAAFEHERRFVADASHELRTPLALLKTELEIALRRPPHARGARAGAPLGLRGDRAADAARRGPAADRALRRGRAADPARAGLGGRGARRRRRAVLRAWRASAAGRSRCGRRTGSCSTPTRRGSSRRSATSSTTRSRTAAAGSCSRRAGAASSSSCTSRTRGRASRPSSSAGAFDRFSRSPTSRTGSGSGLGLSIVELIAEAHGGAVGAANRRGRRRGRLDRRQRAGATLRRASDVGSSTSHLAPPPWTAMQHDSPANHAHAARDAGLARLRRATRVSILGATALAGAFAGVAAHSSPGHKSRPAATPTKRA